MAAQTSGAAAGSVISPSKIVLGSASAGEHGKEGEVLRALLPPTIVIVLMNRRHMPSSNMRKRGEDMKTNI